MVNVGKVRQKTLVGDDKRITSLNTKLQNAKNALDTCNDKVVLMQSLVNRNPGVAKHVQAKERAIKAKEKVEATYIKAVEASARATGSGTGRIGLLLPSSYHRKV